MTTQTAKKFPAFMRVGSSPSCPAEKLQTLQEGLHLGVISVHKYLQNYFEIRTSKCFRNFRLF